MPIGWRHKVVKPRKKTISRTILSDKELLTQVSNLLIHQALKNVNRPLDQQELFSPTRIASHVGTDFKRAQWAIEKVERSRNVKMELKRAGATLPLRKSHRFIKKLDDSASKRDQLRRQS